MTIGHIINNASKFDTLQLQDLKIKRTHTISFQQLEETLKNWMLQQQHQKICLSGNIIKEKGRDFAKRLGMLETDLLFSNGWLVSFEDRNGFKQWKLHGESGDAQMEGIEEKMSVIQSKIAKYQVDDVYNMDETGLFYNMAPNTTIAVRQIEGMIL
jgi:Tc5 transposase DNA-binding domain